MNKRKSIWQKPNTKKKYYSSYERVSLNRRKKVRCFVLYNVNGITEDSEIFESHEKAKQAGWKQLK